MSKTNFTTSNSINKDNFGFCQGHSKINTVIKFLSDTPHATDSGRYNISVFLDFSIIFNTTDKSLLCTKLMPFWLRIF